MKVAFLVNRFPVLSETFIVNQAVGLLERGHEVSIFALEGPPPHLPTIHPEVERYRLRERARHAPAMPGGFLPRALRGMRLFAGSWRRQPLVQLRVLDPLAFGREAARLKLFFAAHALLGAGPFDLTHCQFGTLGLKAVALRRAGALRSEKIVTSFRGYDISLYVRQRGRDCYRELFRGGDFFLANCDYFRERAVDLGCAPWKIVTHRSGIDVSGFPFAPRSPGADGEVRLISVGRLVEKKGFEHALRAVASVLLRAGPERRITYRLIGDGPLRGRLEALAADLGMAGVVEFAGACPQPQVVEALLDAHLFLAPSVTARSGDEDAPVNTLKEAMATGLPVVATRHGGIPELVEDGVSGLLVPERDPQAIAGALVHLLRHAESWPALGRAGRRRVETHYDRDRLNDELVGIYRRVLHGPPADPRRADGRPVHLAAGGAAAPTGGRAGCSG